MHVTPAYLPLFDTEDTLKCSVCGAIRQKEEMEKMIRCEVCGSTTFYSLDLRVFGDIK